MVLKGFDNLAQLNNIARLSRFFNGVFKPFQQFSELYEKAEVNPNSVINHMRYEEALEGFY